MIQSNPGVQRPLLYMIIAIVVVTMALPLAVSTGQTRVGGIFDECFETSCDGRVVVAEAGE